MSPATRMSRPRLGFAGTGWIGCHRLRELVAQDLADIVAVADPSEECRIAAGAVAPAAAQLRSLEELLTLPLDGVVIATPSALHAAQAGAALERGFAVFCQKPLARNADEARYLVDRARSCNRLLGVDLSYRHTRALEMLRNLVQTGELGRVYALDLKFHNAYGPDKPWYRDRALAGGGALCDLGVHLVDLALWLLDFPEADCVSSHLFAQGAPLSTSLHSVEDYASVQLLLGNSVSTRLACSWNLPAGRDADIAVAAFGTGGGACMRNVDGSFYDFVLERYDHTRSTVLVSPPDAWGGRALSDWTTRLAAGEGYSEDAEHFVQVQQVLDQAYQRGAACES